MNTATINATQNKTPRSNAVDAFTLIRDFARALYAAHAGWLVTDAAQRASGALARQRILTEGDTVARQRSLTDRIIVGPFCASALMADMDRTWKN